MKREPVNELLPVRTSSPAPSFVMSGAPEMLPESVTVLPEATLIGRGPSSRMSSVIVTLLVKKAVSCDTGALASQFASSFHDTPSPAPVQ